MARNLTIPQRQDRLRALLGDDLYGALILAAIGHRDKLHAEIGRCLGNRELVATDEQRRLWQETADMFGTQFRDVDALCVFLCYTSRVTPRTPGGEGGEE